MADSSLEPEPGKHLRPGSGFVSLLLPAVILDWEDNGTRSADCGPA